MNKRVRLQGLQINVQGGRLGWTKTRTYWQRTVGAPFLGLYFSGLAGVVVGLLGIAALVVGFYAVTRVRETDRMQPTN